LLILVFGKGKALGGGANQTDELACSGQGWILAQDVGAYGGTWRSDNGRCETNSQTMPLETTVARNRKCGRHSKRQSPEFSREIGLPDSI